MADRPSAEGSRKPAERRRSGWISDGRRLHESSRRWPIGRQALGTFHDHILAACRLDRRLRKISDTLLNGEEERAVVGWGEEEEDSCRQLGFIRESSRVDIL